ncbi:MAG: hypothetical protein DYH05_01345 [Acidobacteria bacterium ACB1]|nr:hypothetical protein [Acidobacteria bacterium ACB1]RIJ88872.1 MAG: hypothetical protein DCC44_12650 [Acidobacteriota bacterium]
MGSNDPLDTSGNLRIAANDNITLVCRQFASEFRFQYKFRYLAHFTAGELDVHTKKRLPTGEKGF